jgi:hypothetical protein
MAILPKGAATFLVKEMLILCERAAISLVKRYTNFTRGAAAPLRKTILILSDRAPPLLLLSLNGSHPFINGTVADLAFSLL